MLPVETLLETEVALLEAGRACELAETRVADLKVLLEEMRADRDYWREQAQRPVLPWWKRIIAIEWSPQRSLLGNLS